jgi:hypothetical protein
MAEDRTEVLAKFSGWLANTLGLQAVDERVAERAMADPAFLNQLIARRKDPVAVADLLAVGLQPSPKWAPPAPLQAMIRLSAALARWAATGFRPVDDQTLQARVSACRRCPHLRPPGMMLHKSIAGSQVCGLCSCAVEKKAALPTETCPATDPDQPGYSRWGEPVSPQGLS